MLKMHGHRVVPHMQQRCCVLQLPCVSHCSSCSSLCELDLAFGSALGHVCTTGRSSMGIISTSNSSVASMWQYTLAALPHERSRNVIPVCLAGSLFLPSHSGCMAC
jgi:hypothetical protein